MQIYKYTINNIGVLYDDDWLLAVDKPAGLLTIPTPKKEKRTLTSILGLYPCHRLDRDTSGVIVYAKDIKTQRKMMELFRTRRVKKIYLALLNGYLVKGGRINFALEGKNAITDYRIIKANDQLTVVEAMPLTGRTNQLRLHFKFIGHPVLGDTRYALRRDFKIKTKRLCLHAQRLEFTHPYTEKKIILEAPLPRDMEEVIRSYA